MRSGAGLRFLLLAQVACVAACALACAAACAPAIEFVGEQAPATCGDERDNDGDGLVDCADPDCADLWVCSLERENTVARCNDGADNDEDGYTDCEDPACIGLDLCAEREDAACANGADDDFDGYADCADASCTGALPCQPPPPELCGNGSDDDGDGEADCLDADCSGDPSCAASPALLPGDCATHMFVTTDPDTAALDAAYGMTESELQGAMSAAKPLYGYYDFSGFGCRWFVVDVQVPAGGASVYAYYAMAPRDYMVVCELPSSGEIAGDDDESALDCTFLLQCGPRLSLFTPGRWTCYFSVSPFDYIGDNDPLGGVLVGCVDPGT